MADDLSADLSRGPVLLSFSLATASFALATTFVRFYVRRGINGGFGADDYTSGAATVIALLGTIFGILESTTPDPTRAVQFFVIGQPWYLISATLSKVSICLFFMGLLRRARQWRILLAGLIVIMAIINLAFALAVYLQCRPLEKVWNPSVAGGCSDPSIQMNFGYAQGAFSVFSWVFLALFPMLIIRDISRGGEPTWPFYATASLSFVSGIFVIVRTAQTSQTTNTNIYTIHFFYASLMANLEQNLSLTTSNLLTLGPLFSSSTTTTGTFTSTTTTTTTTTASTSRSTHRRRRRRDGRGAGPRRDPYSSSSSSGTRKSKRGGGITPNVPSRAGSSRSITRPDTRESSRASLHRSHSQTRGSSEDGGDVVVGGGGEIERKRTTHLIIEGPGVDKHDRDRDLERGEGQGEGQGQGYDLGVRQSSRQTNRNIYYSEDDGDDDGDDDNSEGGGYSDDDDEGDDGYDSSGSDIDLGAWPRGIIKTVSVEVVEEVNEEYVAAAAAAAAAAGAKTAAAAGNDNTRGNLAGGATNSRKGIGRNSVSIVPGVVGSGSRQPRAAPGMMGGDNVDRVSGGSVVEQDWEAMLRAGPPR